MAAFILIHGGGHGGWCYNKLSPLLRAAGLLVYAPSLTGCGDRKHVLSATVDLDTHIADVVNLIEYEDLTDVFLLGHSHGGMVITGVSVRAAGRVGHLVYLDAAYPTDGQSLADISPQLMAMARSEMRVVEWGAAHFLEIDTGHDLMITEPEKVAEMLLAIV